MKLYIKLVTESSGEHHPPVYESFGNAVSKLEAVEDEDGEDAGTYARTGRLDLLKRVDCRLFDAVDEETGMTPLFFACDRGHVDVVEFLLDRGASVNRRDMIGMTCLHVAAMGAREEVYRLLVERGGDESIVDEDGDNPRDCFE
jgi:ankyrin repeat protein